MRKLIIPALIALMTTSATAQDSDPTPLILKPNTVTTVTVPVQRPIAEEHRSEKKALLHRIMKDVVKQVELEKQGKELVGMYFLTNETLINMCQKPSIDATEKQIMFWGICSGYLMGLHDAALHLGTPSFFCNGGKNVGAMREAYLEYAKYRTAEKKAYLAPNLVDKALMAKWPTCER